MDLLHVILAFNLVTTITILASSYAMHRYYDSAPNGEPRTTINVPGLSGAALGVGLMSSLVTLFV